MTFVVSDSGNTEGRERLVWWEKSVEYTFISQMVKAKAFEAVVPLSGNAETALSDALLNFGGKRLLIEFKKDAKVFSSEHRKYVEDKTVTAEIMSAAYEAARVKLVKYAGAGAHGLVYGLVDGASLALKATEYWTPSTGMDVETWCMDHGVDGDVLNEYLDELSWLRFAEVKDGGETGGSRSFVVAVSDKGGFFSCELSEYNNLRPKPKPKHKTDNDAKKGPK